MSKTTLKPYPCPACDAAVEGIVVLTDSILNAKRVPVIIPAKCGKGHAVVLFVDRTFTIRDAEISAEVVDDGENQSSVDKALDWMDSF